jgi:hypothetical protein
MAENSKTGFWEFIAVGALLFFIWKLTHKGTSKLLDLKGAPVVIDPDKELNKPGFDLNSYCKKVVAKPLSQTELTSTSLLGPGWCSKGDGSLIADGDFGDVYAKYQAALYEKRKQDESNFLNRKSVLQFKLINTTASPITTNILDTTQDPAVIDGTDDNGGTPPIPPVPPLIHQIVITTTINGLFSMTLQGTGDVIIDWGDSSPETVPLSGMGDVTKSHSYTGAGVIRIQQPENITSFSAEGDNITAITGLDYCTAITSIDLAYNQISSLVTSASWTQLQYLTLNTNLFTNIITHPEWINLLFINVSDCGLTSFVTRPEWVLLFYLNLSNNHLTTLNSYSQWVNITAIAINRNQITTFNTFAEWIKLNTLDVSYNQLSSIDTFAEWINLVSLDVSYNNLTSLNTYAEWVLLQLLSLRNNQLTSLTTHAEWVKLLDILTPNNPLATIIAHPEWVLLEYMDFTGCAIISDIAINNILINVDNSGATPGIHGINVLLQGGTNAAPSSGPPNGITAKNNLLSKGITVVTN